MIAPWGVSPRSGALPTCVPKQSLGTRVHQVRPQPTARASSRGTPSLLITPPARPENGLAPPPGMRYGSPNPRLAPPFAGTPPFRPPLKGVPMPRSSAARRFARLARLAVQALEARDVPANNLTVVAHGVNDSAFVEVSTQGQSITIETRGPNAIVSLDTIEAALRQTQ